MKVGGPLATVFFVAFVEVGCDELVDAVTLLCEGFDSPVLVVGGAAFCPAVLIGAGVMILVGMFDETVKM